MGSFLTRGLVKRWGCKGTSEGSSPLEVKGPLHSSCSGIGAISEELVSRLSSGTCIIVIQIQIHLETIPNHISLLLATEPVILSVPEVTYLCVVELLLEELDIDAVFPPRI